MCFHVFLLSTFIFFFKSVITTKSALSLNKRLILMYYNSSIDCFQNSWKHQFNFTSRSYFWSCIAKIEIFTKYQEPLLPPFICFSVKLQISKVERNLKKYIFSSVWNIMGKCPDKYDYSNLLKNYVIKLNLEQLILKNLPSTTLCSKT